MEDDKLVWAPDTANGFLLGKIADIGADHISVEPLDGKGKVSFFLLAASILLGIHFVQNPILVI